MTADHIWYKECISVLIDEYGFSEKEAVDLAYTFDEEQREDEPRIALEEEFSYWGD